MERSGSQKALRIISIIGIIFGLLALAMAALMVFASGFVASVTDEAAVEGMSNTEAGALVGFTGLITLVEALIAIIQGILGLRAAKDASKIKPVWILAIIGLVGSVIGAIMFFVNGGGDMSNITSYISSVVFAVIYFWIANNIKQQIA